MWLSQFLSMTGFSLSLPFAPFFLRSLGVSGEGQVRAYAAMAAAASSISFAIMAPIWGVLADRYGRKNMVLRANFAGAAIVALMGFSPNAMCFIVLRAFQGMFTGTISASMTMVASCTPEDKQGFALGFLSSSVFSGDMTGLFVGGMLAEAFGYRNSFHISALILALSGTLVLILAKENFVRPALSNLRKSIFSFSIDWYSWRRILQPAVPLFTLYVFSTLARYLDNSQFPLFVEFLNGGPDALNTVRLTSWVLGMGSIGAVLAGIIFGLWVDKYPGRVAKISLVGAASFMFCMFLISKIPEMSRTELFGLSISIPVLTLMPLRFIMIFFSAGLEPVWNSWLSKITHPEHKGMIFGLASTFRSIGGVIAHSLAGLFACNFGILSIFIFGPLFFLLVLPLLNFHEKAILTRVKKMRKLSKSG